MDGEFHRQKPYNDRHYLALSCLSTYLAGKRNSTTFKVIPTLPASIAALYYARVQNVDTIRVNRGQIFAKILVLLVQFTLWM